MTTEMFRTRWMRWLGQKFRRDKASWTSLLDSTWAGWVAAIYHNHNIPHPHINFMTDRDKLYELYRKAIEVADLNDLQKLDGMYCQEQMEKRYK